MHITVPMFPRSAERGLIEADGADCCKLCCLGFPRSAERGLIEAPLHRVRTLNGTGCFRVQLNAASLKPSISEIDYGKGFDRFRVQLNAASLKPVDMEELIEKAKVSAFS